jgi:hypothetical protein
LKEKVRRGEGCTTVQCPAYYLSDETEDGSVTVLCG